MRSKKRTHRTTVATRAAVESLEQRRMLVTYFGTDNNDVIDIAATSTTTQVTINGSTQITSASTVEIFAGNGDDTFRILSTRAGVTVTANGEAGNDSASNPSTLDLDAVYKGSFTFLGGGGADNFVLDNTNDSLTASPRSLDNNHYFESGDSLLLFYGGVETLDYRDSNAGNTIGFYDLAGINCVVHGNGGNDTIKNSSGNDIGSWGNTGGLIASSAIGGAGIDRLELNTEDSASGNYKFSDGKIELDGTGNTRPLFYAEFETIDFVGSEGANRFEVDGKPAGVAMTIDGKLGNDHFIVGGGDLDSNGFSALTLIGGEGTDRVDYADDLDATTSGETETYTLGAGTLTKGAAVSVSYSSFETLSLDVAAKVVGFIWVVPVVNLNALSTSITSATFTGGSRGGTLNISSGDWAAAVAATLHLSDLSTVNINEQNAGGIVNAYTVNNTQILKGGDSTRTINYASVATLNLNCSGVFDAVAVQRVPANTLLNVNLNAGNDQVNLADGNVSAHLLGRVVVNGGAGNDSLTISNTFDSTLATQTLRALSFTDGVQHDYAGFEQLTLNEGPGGTDLSADGISIPTTINGGGGNDAFSVGGGNISANIPVGTPTAPALVVNGNAGNDSIYFDDRNDTTFVLQDLYQFQRTNGVDQLQRVDNQNRFVNWTTIEAITLDANNISTAQSATTVVDTTTPLRLNGNGGDDYIQVLDASAPITVNTGEGNLDSIHVNTDLDGVPVAFTVDQNDAVDTLTINSGGTLRVTSGATLAKTRIGTSPTLTVNGVLDLAGGAFLSRAGGPTLAQFQTLITRGYNNGAWNGTSSSGAINSSLAAGPSQIDAVGYGLGSEIAVSSLGGFTIAPGDTLLRYTFYGDADLNQTVDFDDFVRTDLGFNTGRIGWTNGDFDFNNTVDFDDFVLIDLAFNTQ